MALFLTENDVKQLLTVTMALEGVESAHRDLSLGQGQDTPRARMHGPQTAIVTGPAGNEVQFVGHTAQIGPDAG